MYICAECYGGPEHVGGNQLKGKEKKKSIQKIKEKRQGKNIRLPQSHPQQGQRQSEGCD